MTETSKRITVKAESRLEAVVKKWTNGRAEDYESGAEGVLKDLFYGGCASGMVGQLVYYKDTLPFYRKHRKEIAAMLAEHLDEFGASSPAEMFKEWDKADPLAQDTNNQNLLAWFGFETAARRLADRQGIEC